jgi:hypothetical protein
MGRRAPQMLQPERGLATQPAVEGVRTPATLFVALTASSVRRADVRPQVGRVSGRAHVRCPRPVHLCCPHRAGSPSASLRRSSPSWAHWVGRVAVVCERFGRRCPNRAWRRRGWSRVGRAWLTPGSTADLGRRSPCAGWGAALAAWPTMGAGSSVRVPAGWLGSTRRSRCSQVPADASWAGGRRDGRPWAGPGGGDHAPWSLCWCWSRVVRLRRAIRMSGGQAAAAARPRYVRRAVARS